MYHMEGSKERNCRGTGVRLLWQFCDDQHDNAAQHESDRERDPCYCHGVCRHENIYRMESLTSLETGFMSMVHTIIIMVMYSGQCQ